MTRMAAILLAVMALAGCDRLGMSPPPAEPAPGPATETTAVPDLRPYVGQTYAEFAAALPKYTPQGLSLTEADAARFQRAMAQPAPAWTISGGGAEALVLTGCAGEGCDAGRGVIGVDLSTGAAFVGVSDAEGGAELIPNDRVEVLLRLSAPSGRWDDAQPADAPPETAEP